MANLDVVHRTEFDKDRQFLRQIQKTEMKTQISNTSHQVKKLADEGIEYLLRKKAACKDIKVAEKSKK